jgi:hypothetical protein
VTQFLHWDLFESRNEMKSAFGKFVGIRRSVAALLTSIVLLPLGTAALAAEPQNADMIEVGGGVAASLTGANYLSVLLRVRGGGFAMGDGGYTVAKIKVDAAVGSSVPYLDIEFTPVTWNFSNPNDVIDFKSLRDAFGGSMSLLRTQIHRDLNLNQKVNLRIDALAFGVGAGTQAGQGAYFPYIQGAISVLGAKVVDFASQVPTTGMFRVASADVEMGVIRKITEGFSVRILVGGEVDYATNVGGSQANRQSGIQSDFSAFAEIRAELMRRINVFVRTAVLATYNGFDRSYSDYVQATAGVTVQF